MLKSKILAMGLAVSVALTSLAPSALSGVSGAAMSGAVQRSAHPYPYPHPGHGPYHHHHKKKRNNAGTAAAVGLGFLTLGILAAGAAERDRYTQRDGYYYPEYPQSYPYPSQQPYPYPEPQQPYYPPSDNGYRYPEQPSPYYPDRNRYDQYTRGGRIVHCASGGYRTTYCPVYGAGRVDLYRKVSSASCRYGRDWGLYQGAIWVANGCRADFVIY